MKFCQWHTCTNIVEGVRSDAIYCSKNCKMKAAVSRRRKELKVKAVEYLGGRCMKCGYNKCVAALDFHHKNEEEKDFGIAAKGVTRSWDKVRAELDKCDLLCANCHREYHSSGE